MAGHVGLHARLALANRWPGQCCPEAGERLKSAVDPAQVFNFPQAIPPTARRLAASKSHPRGWLSHRADVLSAIPDTELRSLSGGPPGVGGEVQPHVSGARGREGDRDRVAG